MQFKKVKQKINSQYNGLIENQYIIHKTQNIETVNFLVYFKAMFRQNISICVKITLK